MNLVYVYLSLAILFEVVSTLLLPVSQNFSKLHIAVCIMVGYGLSVFFLTLSLRGIPLGVAYACWAGLGITLVTVFSYFIYDQALEWQSILGLGLIIIGAVIATLFSTNQGI